MEKNALVLGGTGLVGGYLLTRLQAQGYRMDVVSRRAAQLSSRNAQVVYKDADLSRTDWAASIDFSAYDTIFHLAYATHGEEDYNWAVTVRSVQSIFDALAELQDQKSRHFVYVGSMVTFGNQPEGEVSEDSPRHPKSAYAHHKTEATRIALSPPAGVMSTVLHPTGVYDASSRRIMHYRELLAYNYLPKTAQLGINNIIYADDVAAAMVQCLKRPTREAAAEYIINGECVPYHAWFGQLESTVAKKSWVRMPGLAQWVCRGPLRKAMNRVGVGCPLHFTSSAEGSLNQRARYSTAKAARDFGFRPSVMFSDVCKRIQESGS